MVSSYAAPMEASQSHEHHLIGPTLSPQSPSEQHLAASHVSDTPIIRASAPSNKRARVESQITAKKQRTIQTVEHGSDARNEGKPIKPKAKTPKQRIDKRRDRARQLGLQQDSPIPLFTHSLTDEEMLDHPHIQMWKQHREAMRQGTKTQDQLPALFQPSRGHYKFLRRDKKTAIEDQYSTEQQRKDRYYKARFGKTAELKLAVNSALPAFAIGVNADQLKGHPNIGDWHEHRKAVEDGTIQQHHLPEHFQSSQPGRLQFITKGYKDVKVEKPAASNILGGAQIQPHTAERKAQRQAHYQKLDSLGLRKDSAVPLFAFKLKNEHLEHHDDMESWNHHRSLLEHGKITEDQLPHRFKSHGGNNLRVRKPMTDAASDEAMSVDNKEGASSPKSTILSSQQTKSHESTTQHGASGKSLPRKHQEGSVDRDPFAFLHHMILD